MTIDPSSLLAGPRGRRLLLECARGTAGRQGQERLLSTLLQVEHDLEPSGGSLIVRFQGAQAPRTERQAHSPAEVAVQLDELALTALTGPELLSSFRDTVDTARYWQLPDGGDILGALPRLRSSLTRIAEHVCRSPSAAALERPLDLPNQWSVLPADADRAHSGVQDELRRWRSATIDEEETAARDRPADPRAPFSGSWWSAPPRTLVSSTGSWAGLGPVGLWLIEDSMGWADLTAFPVSAAPRSVWEIDGPGAWVELSGRYPLEVTASRRHDWFRVSGGAERWVLPDWSRVADDFEAVHLTMAGYLTTAGRELAVGAGFSTMLAGWDPDATFWLTDDVRLGAPEAWHRDDDDWRRAP